MEPNKRLFLRVRHGIGTMGSMEAPLVSFETKIGIVENLGEFVNGAEKKLRANCVGRWLGLCFCWSTSQMVGGWASFGLRRFGASDGRDWNVDPS